MTSVDSSPPPPAQQQQTTLSLMPVSPVEEKAVPVASVAVALPPAGPQLTAPPLALSHLAAVASWLTVEEVTAMWRDGVAPACVGPGVDDDAPAFVSDQWGHVMWSNVAFSRAVSADDDAVDTAPLVALAGALPAWGTCTGFTCAAPRRAGSSSMVAPCDVWRLDAGGCYL
ncbi:hypothetical protein BAE44_0023898 [Dichanthelium oligosanthes]|uniref:DUF7950 domain-containing protein n=1 Tax=Dichanthelium oligosanthes TaxID=888268 RepID=A0A1E5UQF2_9POAL|nr:hypothetical protein BAE44_0023898 [Dichanthelium oligosanthes]